MTFGHPTVGDSLLAHHPTKSFTPSSQLLSVPPPTSAHPLLSLVLTSSSLMPLHSYEQKTISSSCLMQSSWACIFYYLVAYSLDFTFHIPLRQILKAN